MLYRNGRPARAGDKVLIIDGYNAGVAGVLYDIVLDNGKLAPIVSNAHTANLRECLHLDDVAGACQSLKKEE